MFRLRKGRQDDKNRKNVADEKNTHEIKTQNKDKDMHRMAEANRAFAHFRF